MQSQNNIGTLYDKGRDVPVNYIEAFKWFKLAADQELDLAKFNLATMYDTGRGVPQNYGEALKLYQSGAQQGNAQSINNLATIYYNGRGVNKDTDEGYRLFNLAADKGNLDAHHNLAILSLKKNNIADALNRLNFAANQGHKKAQTDLGSMYYKGENVAKDYTQAAKYLRMAALQSDDTAQYQLAKLYSEGDDEKNQIESLKWLRYAASEGNVQAETDLKAALSKRRSLGLPEAGLDFNDRPLGMVHNRSLERNLEQALKRALQNQSSGKNSSTEKVKLFLRVFDDGSYKISLANPSGNPDTDREITSILPNLKLKLPPTTESNQYMCEVNLKS